MPSEEFTKEDWERLNNYAVEQASSILDPAEHPHFAKRNLIAAAAANIGLIAGWILIPRLFLWTFPNDPDVLSEFYVVYVFLILGTFACGFLFAYFAFKLYRIYFADKSTVSIDSGVMSGFSYADHRDKNWKIWLIAAAAGVINLLAVRLFVNFIGHPLMDRIWKVD